jgi:hypothetical protein
MKRAAYPAKKIRPATKIVDAYRAFIKCVCLFLH